MAPSRLNSLAQFLPRLTGLLRSSHALLGLLAVVCLLFFSLSRTINPFVSTGSFVLFALLLLGVLYRFAFKGPEADRAQPVVSISYLETRILNIEPAAMERLEFRELIKEIIKHRRALPAPAGIVNGPASNPSSIREITPSEAEQLRKQDNVPSAIEGG